MNGFLDTEDEEEKTILLDTLETVYDLMQYRETLKDMGNTNSIMFAAVQTLLNTVVKTSCTWVSTCTFTMVTVNYCTV